MIRRIWLLAALFALLAASAATPVFAGSGRASFGFSAGDVAGFPTGRVSISGGGSFDLATETGHAGGGFSCLDSVEQLALKGCLAGQGVRWDSSTLVTTTGFKCTGALSEALKHATTGPDTLILDADFYRAGDANDESFTALMIVSTTDLDPQIDGFQNVWVQGVGCGTGAGSSAAAAS
jgi:hypothetical protein